MLLARFPRVSLAHLPTPLEFLPRLTEHLGGPNIYVKRDDCTGLGTGGNKTRKLEFLVADAIEKKADVIITQGAVQSNHARQTAAAACKVGMACELIFEKRVADADEAYRTSGNVLLDRIYGANIREVEKGTDMNAAMEALADELRADGKTVAAYAAAAKGATLVNFAGIDHTRIDFTVDRAAAKQNMLMPGSKIPIYAPEAIVEKMPDYVLMLAWNFADEILAQQAEYREKGGKFIVPVPTPHIV